MLTLLNLVTTPVQSFAVDLLTWAADKAGHDSPRRCATKG